MLRVGYSSIVGSDLGQNLFEAFLSLHELRQYENFVLQIEDIAVHPGLKQEMLVNGITDKTYGLERSAPPVCSIFELAMLCM